MECKCEKCGKIVGLSTNASEDDRICPGCGGKLLEQSDEKYFSILAGA